MFTLYTSEIARRNHDLTVIRSHLLPSPVVGMAVTVLAGFSLSAKKTAAVNTNGNQLSGITRKGNSSDQ